MILGIDASNIRSGGGLTHLKEILENAEPNKYNFEKVIVWSNNETLARLPYYPWLQKETHNWLNKSFVFSFLFQILLLSKIAVSEKCNLIFVPGGTFFGSFQNIVSMSQNMLPFEKEERNRFPNWKSRLRFKILHFTQGRTFKNSKGVIFLTNYAKNYIVKDINLKTNSEIIPHGINLSFLNEPKVQKDISKYTKENPFKLLYVSIVTVYKHQWNVADVVIKLRKEGYPITLDLVGGNTSESLEKLMQVLKKDNEGCVEFKGLVQYNDLENIYKSADGFIFASSCENMPIILIEAMTAGLPIASSNKGPMPEVLGDACFYFNPLDTNEIYLALKNMINSSELRTIKSLKSYNKSINYTWKECSEKTFEYLSRIAKQYNYENTK
ncbi:MAG TPA: glycosyltransferase family 1 protein [Lutibacter sp.]